MLLEEVGHAIDTRINRTDTGGDEGALFSALVRGEHLDEVQLQALRSEDDRATVVLDGKQVSIEQATRIVNDEFIGNELPPFAYKTIAAAIAAANPNDTIVVTGGSDNIHREAGIRVNKNLKIIGDGNVTIDAQGSSSTIFSVNDGNSSNKIGVTIDGLKIIGGKGGAIFNAEDLTLKNSDINNNSSSFGGGIFNSSSGTLNLFEIGLSGNTATEGGGIFNNQGENLFLNKTTLLNNKATLGGGGIENRGDLNLTSSNFISNTAPEGGGIFNFDSGKLYLNESNNILDNVATFGGGIENRGNIVYALSSNYIVGNSASNSGGGIYNSPQGTLGSDSLLLSNITFDRNSAPDGGGLVNFGKAYLSGITVKNNSASDDGGGIFNNTQGYLRLSNVELTNNTATDLDFGQGEKEICVSITQIKIEI